MIIDATRSLQMALDAAGTDVVATVDFIEYNAEGAPTAPSTAITASNGTTFVTILSAPDPLVAVKREPIRISIYNGNAGTRVVDLRTLAGVTATQIYKVSASSTKAHLWERGTQWQFNV